MANGTSISNTLGQQAKPRHGPDLTGQRFGKYVVVSWQGCKSASRWLCRCDCGREKIVRSDGLAGGSQCYCVAMPKRIAGIRTHGGSGTVEYRCWSRMRRRCLDPKDGRYHRYGGRGITVCPEWRKSFARFFADMGPRPPGHTLERKDNDGPYSPGNCVWATPKQQSQNTILVRRLTFRGETHSQSVWCERLGIRLSTLRRRLSSGWSVEEAFTIPVAAYRRSPA